MTGDRWYSEIPEDTAGTAHRELPEEQQFIYVRTRDELKAKLPLRLSYMDNAWGPALKMRLEPVHPGFLLNLNAPSGQTLIQRYKHGQSVDPRDYNDLLQKRLAA